MYNSVTSVVVMGKIVGLECFVETEIRKLPGEHVAFTPVHLE